MIQHNVGHWQQQQQPQPQQQQQPQPHQQQSQQQQQYQQNVLIANVPQHQNQVPGFPVVTDQNQNHQQNSYVYGQLPAQAAVGAAPPPPAQFFNQAAYQQRPIKTAEQPFNPAFQQNLSQPIQQQNATTDASNYYQHQQTIQKEEQQGLAQNFFDHSQNNKNNNNNNNNNSKGDSWGDWGDWNDNNNIVDKQQDQQKQQLHQHEQYFNSPSQQQQKPTSKTEISASVINDSFNASDNNNWNWNMMDTNKQNSYNNVLSQNPMPPAPTQTTTTTTSHILIPAPLGVPSQAPQQQSQPNLESTVETNEKIQPILRSVPDIGNDNFNNVSASVATMAGNIANNIPSSVYVSQAKPVTMPSRQFASPPAEVVPLAAEQVFAPPPPPEGFQNDPPKISSPPRMQVPPPLPTASVPSAANANPFKRAGATQHHVANFIPTAPIVNKNAIASPAAAPPPALLAMTNTASDNNNNNGTGGGNAFFVPPPSAPGAPIQMSFEPPENSEILHENQEVLAHNFISNENNAPAAIPQQQPLNAERNQYLQTSHLSENAMDDSNIEGDNLPPPGLSRLVLGQPEYRANQQQRMVTGTEDTLENLVVNMNLEERQADGEDNASMANNPINRNISNVPMTNVNATQCM